MVGEQVDAVRREILCLPRDTTAIAAEVVKMRKRMREHLLPVEDPERFHLKQGLGGIVDIEFLVQYWVLSAGAAHPDLATWSDNVRILEVLGQEGLLPLERAEALTQAYLDYRGAAHQLALQQQPGEVAGDYFLAERALATESWNAVFDGIEPAAEDT